MKQKQTRQLEQTLEIFAKDFQSPCKVQSIELEFESGKTKIKGKLIPESDSGNPVYTGSWTGKNIRLTPEQLPEQIAKEASLYDAVRVIISFGNTTQTITADNKTIRLTRQTEDQKAINHSSFAMHTEMQYGVSSARKYTIRIDEAAKLLQAIGILDLNGKLLNDKIRKYNQIDRFVEMVDPILRKEAKSGRIIRICDMACGKSYLSFVLHYYVTVKLGGACQIIGLDRMESAIHSSKEIAKKLKIPDMVFQVADLADYKYQGPPPSLCICLHACDIATDYAIYSAIKAKSRAIVVVPCCHRELLDASVEFSDLDRSLFRHGFLKERFSSLMTEALRGLLLEAHGYKVSISEYISPLDSPKNIMIKALKYKNDDKKAMAEYEKLSRQHGCNITLGRLLHSLKKEGTHKA